MEQKWTGYYHPGFEDAKWIREEVFVKEQGFDDEFDEIDAISLHVTLSDQEGPMACGRLFRSDEEEQTFVCGRIAALSRVRGHGFGRVVMELLEQKARELGANKLHLSAQKRVQGFYEKLGYIAHGEEYLSQFCPHIGMDKPLKEEAAIPHFAPTDTLPSFVPQGSRMEHLILTVDRTHAVLGGVSVLDGQGTIWIEDTPFTVRYGRQIEAILSFRLIESKVRAAKLYPPAGLMLPIEDWGYVPDDAPGAYIRDL